MLLVDSEAQATLTFHMLGLLAHWLFDVKQAMESSAISCWSKQAVASPWDFHFKPRCVAVGHVCPSHDRLQLVASPFVAACFQAVDSCNEHASSNGAFFQSSR